MTHRNTSSNTINNQHSFQLICCTSILFTRILFIPISISTTYIKGHTRSIQSYPFILFIINTYSVHHINMNTTDHTAMRPPIISILSYSSTIPFIHTLSTYRLPITHTLHIPPINIHSIAFNQFKPIEQKRGLTLTTLLLHSFRASLSFNTSCSIHSYTQMNEHVPSTSITTLITPSSSTPLFYSSTLIQYSTDYPTLLFLYIVELEGNSHPLPLIPPYRYSLYQTF